MLFALALFSLPWIRHRFYESFYWLHIALAITYVGIMFWRAGLEGDSWDYLWATIAIWIASILIRILWLNSGFRTRQSEWFVESPAKLIPHPGGMTRIDILKPQDFHWRLGQHVFLRFPEDSLFDNHPFTITSADGVNLQSTAADDLRIISFFVRTHAGFTKRLSHYLENHLDADVRVWIDGPYGGMSRKVEVSFDNVILVAGGVGITACLPWLEYLTNVHQSSTPSRISHVKLVWAVRERAHAKWIIAELESREKSVPKDMLEICIHVTDQDSEGTKYNSGIELHPIGKCQPVDYKELGSKTIRALKERSLYSGRPSMNKVLASVGHGRTIVIGKLSDV